MSVSTVELVEAVRHLELSGPPVCVHCSLRSFGRVNGGADAVINAFTDEGATLLVPSFPTCWGAGETISTLSTFTCTRLNERHASSGRRAPRLSPYLGPAEAMVETYRSMKSGPGSATLW